MQKECNVCHMVFSEEDIIKYSGTNNTCPVCHTKNSFIEEYIMDIKRISNDPDFIQAMIELKKNDPIEYQLKMSQFKANLKQQVSSKIVEEDNKVHCPNCHSTNIKAITGTERAMSIMGLGIFSKKINKSFKCLNCKYTW